MTKSDLIKEIYAAFGDVKLEDGVGLWEAHGLDDHADDKTMSELRKKDERFDWKLIPSQDLMDCQSSLSFFDAKGMRFCLPGFLLFDLCDEKSFTGPGLSPPDVVFTLGYKLDGEYQKARYSLFNRQQVQCVIHYLEYKIEEIIVRYKGYSSSNDSTLDAVYDDYDYMN